MILFCSSVRRRYQSRVKSREKVHKYALNVYSEVYKDPWWPAHEQCGVMWSLRDAAEEQDPGCSADSIDGAVLQCSCRRQARWCCFLSLLLFDKVGSGKMSHECVAKCITCGVFDHGQRRTESTTEAKFSLFVNFEIHMVAKVIHTLVVVCWFHVVMHRATKQCIKGKESVSAIW